MMARSAPESRRPFFRSMKSLMPNGRCTRRGCAALWGVVCALASCSRAPESQPVAQSQPMSQSHAMETPNPLRVEPGLLIAHALGSVAGIAYTNSLEAFECNYARGHRWFEVDLALTADDELFCFHSGHEDKLGLQTPVSTSTAKNLEGRKYAGRYPLVRFSELLERTDRLGDVVLVTDTKGWPDRMQNAVRRTVEASGKKHPTRLVLQAYGRHDIAAVKHLSREFSGDIIFTLYMADTLDEDVVRLATTYGALAVVADSRRFSPWLAKRLHEEHLPVLVHTINEHRDVIKLTHAGADGFYTDNYKPYGTPGGPLPDCALAPQMTSDKTPWLERDIHRSNNYKLSACAKRRSDRVEVSKCEPGVAIRGFPLSVPPHRSVRVTLDVQAGDRPARFWFEMLGKFSKAPSKQRKELQLAAKERRLFEFDVPLDGGSAGFETRLGVDSPAEHLIVYGLTASHKASTQSTLAGATPAHER